MSAPDRPDVGPQLIATLEHSRDHGLLGPGPVEAHIGQARAFLAVLGDRLAGQVADLGSGGGVPGLILATWVPSVRWRLVDASARRTRFLEGAVRDLGLGGWTEVVHARAEELGRDPGWRGRMDGVVARSFGPPAVVAECAAPLLRPGGVLAVSEPPGPDAGRWPEGGLEPFGLVLRDHGRRAGYQMAELRQAHRCPARFPRRPGVPARAPLF
jgi:16S rRNA (guanine527-N7)-methyltransferase